MAQTGFTPIQLYRTATASAQPTAGNLADGELAINTNDGRLFYKDNVGAVQVIGARLGANVATALGTAVGTAGSFVVNGGALGTPSSGTLTNATGLPIVAGTTGTLTVARGGTGLTTTPTNGQLLIGNGTGYTVANLTAGSGIGISNGSGTITISNTATAAAATPTARGTVFGLTGTSGNAALGQSALLNNSSGSGNVAIGEASVYTNSSGSSNIGVGFQALYSANGADNIAIGTSAGYAVTSGHRNILIGTTAGWGFGVNDLTTGSNNIVIGYDAQVSSSSISNEATWGNSSITRNRFWGDLRPGGSNAGTSGQVLTSQGAGVTPTWTTISLLTGVTNSGSPFTTALGFQALNGNSGTFNTAVGYNALSSSNSGSTNSAFGYQALLSNTSAGKNTAVGFNALSTNTTSENSTAVGYWSLLNSTGARNTAVGSETLLANTSAADNVAFGYQSGDQITTGQQNVVIGASAASSGTNDLTTGSNNIIIGFNAAASSATVSNEVTIGNASITRFRVPGLGIDWTSAPANLSGVTQSVSPFETSLGFEAGLNTTGTHNTFAGYQAGRANTSGALNTYVGSWAGRSGTTGNSNVAVGYQAMQAVNTGSRNNVVGRESLFTNTSGYQNNAFGYQTLYLNTTGFNNVALGDQALYSNTTGRDSVAIGTTALYSNTTGQFNIGIGNSSLLNVATTNHNIGVGWEAGRTVTGAQNILIGGFAGATGTNNLTTGSNNIIIGYNAEASSATVSNEVTIGNTSITSTRLRGVVELNAAMLEACNVSATAATGTINFDVRTQSVLYYTTNASGNWTLNVRAASGVSLDSIMLVGESVTIAFLVTNGATAYYQTGFQVDGVSVTPRWQGGTAPTQGNTNSIDAYVVTIIKTAAATFTVLESQTRFA